MSGVGGCDHFDLVGGIAWVLALLATLSTYHTLVNEIIIIITTNNIITIIILTLIHITVGVNLATMLTLVDAKLVGQ